MIPNLNMLDRLEQNLPQEYMISTGNPILPHPAFGMKKE